MSERKIAIRKYSILDKETGEIIADDAMFIGKNAFVDRGFRKVFVGFLKDVVTDKDISGKSIRLLLYILENLKPNSLEVYLYWKDVCQELEITQGTYFNWLKTLINKGYIERTNRPFVFILKPYTGVNGQMDRAVFNTMVK